MDVDAIKERHNALKRKANMSMNDLLEITKSSSAKRKAYAQKLCDVEGYKSIIKTYKAPVWCGCAVSPRDLADYGWSCVKKNTVKCVECNQVLSTILPNITTVSINVYNSSLKHIHEKMKTAHRVTCLKRTGSAPFRLVEPTASEVIKGIEERLAGGSSFTANDMTVDIPNGVSVPKMDKASPAFVFTAALGWKIAKARRGYISLSCDLCARDLILKTGAKFDPIHNHERWCPRVDKNDNGDACWQTDLNVVLNEKNKTAPSSMGQIYKDYFSARRILAQSVSSVIPSCT
ncbi:unnamed protein product [Caenorhabditis bovis]|uniref:C3HC-type domain-containing protein n=1 Tax=Caenorhabditis bovis TaxID=2654633 RepID=A0A8S1FEL3_9PELO|nr:unnamed protein product [Caenorhabditis bovis]